MNLFLTNNRTLHQDKTCNLPSRHMENNRFCPHPDVPERIVPYTQCSLCQFNKSDKSRQGLYNSVRLLTQALPDSVLVMIDKTDDIIKAIHDYRPEVVIIESLIVDPSRLAELVKLYPAKYIVRIHSKLPFLATEGDSLQKIIAYTNITGVTLSLNNLEANNDFISAGFQTIYLPNIYSFLDSDNVVKPIKDTIEIGCFGSIRYLKNQLQQLFTSIRFAKESGLRLRFHMNTNRTEHYSEHTLPNIRTLCVKTKTELVEHAWMNSDSLKGIIRDLHLGIQFSLTESFNIVTADFISQNIPVAVSREIKFVSPEFKADPVDSDSIIGAMQNAINGISTFQHLKNNILLKEYNIEATRIWREFLCL